MKLREIKKRTLAAIKSTVRVEFLWSTKDEELAMIMHYASSHPGTVANALRKFIKGN